MHKPLLKSAIEAYAKEQKIEVLEEMGNLYPSTKKLLDYKIKELKGE